MTMHSPTTTRWAHTTMLALEAVLGKLSDEQAARVQAVLCERWPADSPQWQPIETAPKDGTDILLCWAINAAGERIDWSEHPDTAGVFVQVASWWNGENDWIVYCSLPNEPRLHFNPTHWMPLPGAPK